MGNVSGDVRIIKPRDVEGQGSQSPPASSAYFARVCTAEAGMAIETDTELLVRATLEHRIVRFRYRGMTRTVEPHLVGHHEAGETLLVGYQTGGESGSGELPGWRTFVTADVEAVEIGDGTFAAPRGDFAPQTHRMVEIFARA